MSNVDSHHYQRGGTETRHSKEDALDVLEFERLLEGAWKITDMNGIRAPFTILTLGRLGLRRGELCHLDQSWINRRKDMIEIPRYHSCSKGKGDGPCGMCKQLARQRADRNDDLTEEEAFAQQWQAKTDQAARGVYYGYDARIRLWYDRFFEMYDRWEWSAMKINRIVNECAEAAEGLSPDRVRPHSLRASAASYHAAKGLDTEAILQHFGWCGYQTAKYYIARNEDATARKMDSVHTG